jgi:copper(I)-binding protein
MTIATRRLGFVAFALAFVLLAVSALAGAQAHEGTPGYRKGQIHAVEAWARINPVAGRPGAVFLTLHNESKVADALVSASSPIAGRVEVHGHEMDGDVMRMVKVKSVPVGVEEVELLEPGGLHIMLFDLKQQPKPGTRFPLTLSFQRGKPQTIQVEVKPLGFKPAGGSGHSHKGGGHHHH